MELRINRVRINRSRPVIVNRFDTIKRSVKKTVKFGFLNWKGDWYCFEYDMSWYYICGDWFIFTARKWSLGQGNIFAPICHSVHRGGACFRGRSGPGGGLLPGGSDIRGALLLEGSGPRGGAWWRPPLRRVLLRAVCILLECIFIV